MLVYDIIVSCLQLSPSLQTVPTNVALHLVKMAALVLTDTMTTSVYVPAVILERAARQVRRIRASTD